MYFLVWGTGEKNQKEIVVDTLGRTKRMVVSDDDTHGVAVAPLIPGICRLRRAPRKSTS